MTGAKKKIEFDEPNMDEATIIALSKEWGQADWKRGRVILHAKDGSTRMCKFQNLPENAIVVIPFEEPVTAEE